MADLVSPLLAIAAALAVIWFLRRILPRVQCPQCGSSSWFLMGDMKQCSQCVSLFV
jgi:hypothetical protein